MDTAENWPSFERMQRALQMGSIASTDRGSIDLEAPAETSPAYTWLKFLVDFTLASRHDQISMLFGRPGVSARNSLLDELLPSLLYMRMGSLLDEFLEGYIDSNGLVMNHPYRDRFFDRINFLHDQGRLSDSDALHAIRERRNDLAHGTAASSTWQELEKAIGVAHAELHHLSILEERPNLEFFAGRVGVDPLPGHVFAHEYYYGLKIGNDKIWERRRTLSYADPVYSKESGAK